jgi:hypothetical protein
MESCFVVVVVVVVSLVLSPDIEPLDCSVVVVVVVSESDFLEQPDIANAELRARPATSASAKYLRIS